MNNDQSLALIQQMIAEAKQSFRKQSPYFLIWGVVLSISGIAEHLIVYKMGNVQGYLAWGVMGTLGGILSAIYSMRSGKNAPTSNFYDKAYGFVWGGFGITLILIILLSVLNKQNPTPYVLLATGLPTFVSGGLTKFLPLKLGGFVFWAAGALAFYVDNAQTGLLFSLAIILGYLIPGILLHRSESSAAT